MCLNHDYVETGVQKSFQSQFTFFFLSLGTTSYTLVGTSNYTQCLSTIKKMHNESLCTKDECKENDFLQEHAAGLFTVSLTTQALYVQNNIKHFAIENVDFYITVHMTFELSITMLHGCISEHSLISICSLLSKK